MKQFKRAIIGGVLGVAIFLAIGLFEKPADDKLADEGVVEAVDVVDEVPVKLSPLALMKKPKAYVLPEEPVINKVALLNPEDITSQYAMLIRMKTQDVLFQKNSDVIIYPASLTKIMTAIVAIEHIEDLNQTVVITKDAFTGLQEAGAAMAGFMPGEEIRGIDLLYGLLLPSGAECGKALAYEVSGGVDTFVALMNDKAEALGMTDTHFVNTTGLHDPNHYTTVKDLSILLQYALENETFRGIYTSPGYAIPADNMNTKGLQLISTLFKHEEAITIRDGEIIGGKTGYTSAAGLCLSSLARIEDEEYIFITAGADGNHYTEPFNIEDAVKAYNSIVSEDDTMDQEIESTVAEIQETNVESSGL